MEKLGVGKSELVKELEAKYLELKEQQVALVKTGTAQKNLPELEAIKLRIDELKAE